jgi:hypothetical protein
MWVAVMSLAAEGLTSAAVSVAVLYLPGRAGWTIYTPNSSPNPWPLRIIEIAGYAQRCFIPIAALSSAAYIFLLERELRQPKGRGFAVEVTPPFGEG